MQHQKHWEKFTTKENDKKDKVAGLQPPFLKIEVKNGMTCEYDRRKYSWKRKDSRYWIVYVELF